MTTLGSDLFVIDRRLAGKHRLDLPTPSGDTLKITPYGGGSEVGRSCILLEYKDCIIMLDCGIHPGKTGREALPYFDEIDNIAAIDLLLVSHFHLDHAASLPYFVNKTEFCGRIFMTHPTKDIFQLILKDYLNVSNSGNGDLLYDEKDLNQTMTKIETVDFYTVSEVNGIKFECLKAGHVLGAAMFMIQIADIKILYTGDYSRQEDRHLMPAEIPSEIPDVLIIEATYGNTTHKTRIEREAKFTSFIHQVIKSRGRCLIPVFALGRAQELLLILDEYWEANRDELGKVPIYYASALAKRCLRVYRNSSDVMSENIRSQAKSGKNPFEFRHVRNLPRIEELDDSEPCVVMASPGMLQNGPSRKLFDKWCADEKNGVIVPGYSVKGTLAYEITTVRPTKIKTSSGQEVMLRMKVEDVSFSAHADFDDTSNFVTVLRPPQIVLVHGDTKMMDDLKQGLNRVCENLQGRRYAPAIHTPKNNESVTLHFSKEKYARVVGRLASNPSSNEGKTLSGLIVKKKDFSYQILDPVDLSEYTQLSVVTIKQTVRIIYRHSFDILEYFVRQMFFPVIREYPENSLLVEDVIQVTQNETGVSLSWDTDPMNDMLADSLIAFIAQIETNPNNIKYFPRTSCQHEHHTCKHSKDEKKDGEDKTPNHEQHVGSESAEKKVPDYIPTENMGGVQDRFDGATHHGKSEKSESSHPDGEDVPASLDLHPIHLDETTTTNPQSETPETSSRQMEWIKPLLGEFISEIEFLPGGQILGQIDGVTITVDLTKKVVESQDKDVQLRVASVLNWVLEKTEPIPRA